MASDFWGENLFVDDDEEKVANEVIRELGNQFGVDIQHTAVHSPWIKGFE